MRACPVVLWKRLLTAYAHPLLPSEPETKCVCQRIDKSSQIWTYALDLHVTISNGALIRQEITFVMEPGLGIHWMPLYPRHPPDVAAPLETPIDYETL